MNIFWDNWVFKHSPNCMAEAAVWDVIFTLTEVPLCSRTGWLSSTTFPCFSSFTLAFLPSLSSTTDYVLYWMEKARAGDLVVESMAVVGR